MVNSALDLVGQRNAEGRAPLHEDEKIRLVTQSLLTTSSPSPTTALPCDRHSPGPIPTSRNSARIATPIAASISIQPRVEGRAEPGHVLARGTLGRCAEAAHRRGNVAAFARRMACGRTRQPASGERRGTIDGQQVTALNAQLVLAPANASSASRARRGCVACRKRRRYPGLPLVVASPLIHRNARGSEASIFGRRRRWR